MEWGSQLEFLLRVEQDTGRKPKSLLERPQLEARNREYFEIFNDLSRSRVVSQGDYQSITMGEILAYMHIEGIPQHRGGVIRRMVQALDWVYLEEITKRRARENKSKNR